MSKKKQKTNKKHSGLFDLLKCSLNCGGGFGHMCKIALSTVAQKLQIPFSFFEILKLLIETVKRELESESPESMSVIPLEYFKLVTLYYDITEETADL